MPFHSMFWQILRIKVGPAESLSLWWASPSSSTFSDTTSVAWNQPWLETSNYRNRQFLPIKAFFFQRAGLPARWFVANAIRRCLLSPLPERPPSLFRRLNRGGQRRVSWIKRSWRDPQFKNYPDRKTVGWMGNETGLFFHSFLFPRDKRTTSSVHRPV